MRPLFFIEPVASNGVAETLSGVNSQLMGTTGMRKEIHPVLLSVNHPILGSRGLSVVTDQITSGSLRIGSEGVLQNASL